MSAATVPTAAQSWGTRHQLATSDTVSATVRSLKNVRWAVRAALILGVAASVAANILHAQSHLISQAIAAWPPIALLLTVELISRVPVHRKLLAAARLIATTTIAGIAAWVSYWHMVGVAARYGETGLSAYLLPVSVDGLIIVASISLVELSARLHLAQSAPPATPPVPPPARSAPPVAEPPATEPPAAGPVGHPPIALANTAPVDDAALGDPPPADTTPSYQPDPTADHDPTSYDEPVTDEPPDDRGTDTDDESHHGDDAGDNGGPGNDRRQRRSRGATRKAVIDAYLKDPTKHPTAIAEEVGTSERTVRRYLEEFRTSAGTDSPNGTKGAERARNGSPR